MEKIMSSPQNYHAKRFFSVDKYQLKIWVENLEIEKKVFCSAFHPLTKLILLHTVVVLHYIPYKNGILGHERGGGRCKNAQKQFIIRAH